VALSNQARARDAVLKLAGATPSALATSARLPLTAGKSREAVARSRVLSDEKASEFGCKRPCSAGSDAAPKDRISGGRDCSIERSASTESPQASKHRMLTFGEHQVPDQPDLRDLLRCRRATCGPARVTLCAGIG
jgi:hypothetical protein